MCFALPVKIISTKNKKIIIEDSGRRKRVSGSLVRVKAGDYAILENNFIIKKVDPVRNLWIENLKKLTF